jgi:chorismate synthase
MASNKFGEMFQITTWGESHGIAIGVVIDGCPANLLLSEEELNIELQKRWPKNDFSSKRSEMENACILSGIYNGSTTGAPISIMIFNKKADSSRYDKIKNLLRPSHANYTYIEKYKNFDHRGGGRASARETATRLIGGFVAKKLLQRLDKSIKITAYLSSVGNIQIDEKTNENFSQIDFDILDKKISNSSIFCPCEVTENKMLKYLQKISDEKDSIGGAINLLIHCPIGLGDPIFEKLSCNLSKAITSIPGCKGIEIGSGYKSSKMKGSEYNDLFYLDKNDQIRTKTNNSGGMLGGISNGEPIIIKAHFKPTPSIAKDQQTIDISDNSSKTLTYNKIHLHDTCIAIRAVKAIIAMANITIADAYLKHKFSKLEDF